MGEYAPTIEDEVGSLQEEGDLHLIGRVRDRLLALPLRSLKSANRIERHIHLPGVPELVFGLISFDGAIEVAVDLGIRFGFSRLECGEATRAVLLARGELRAALLFDELLGMAPIKPDEVLTSSQPLTEESVKVGNAKWNGHDVAILDTDTLADNLLKLQR